MKNKITLLVLALIFSTVLFAQEKRDTKFIQFDASEKHSLQEAKQLLQTRLKLSSDDDLIKTKTEQDLLGFTHEKYQQYFKGIKVEFGTYKVHAKNGAIQSMNGELFAVGKLKTRPSLSPNSALNKAVSHVGAKSYVWENKDQARALDYQKPKGELVIFPKIEGITNSARLAYKFDIYSQDPLYRAEVYVDATNGEVIFENAKIHHANVSSNGASLYNGNVNFTADNSSGPYRLRQTENGNGIETYDLNNGTNYANATDITSSSSTFNHQTGVQAHWGAEQTHQYYLNSLGRNSYDGSGAVIKSYVSYKRDYVNAFWDGQRMTYGDGDGVNYGPLVSLDIVGHEITHGVTEYSANLIYSYQSGALNESFSDIFGESIEKYASSSNDWLMGDQIGSGGSGGALRSMSNPNAYGDPDTYMGDNWYYGTGDNGGVHYNSGVQNKWFYILTAGESGTNDINRSYTVTGIGIENAAKIAYRNLTLYLSSNSNYADARTGAIQAAVDLFGSGSLQEIATTNAWYAVGVGDVYVQTCTLPAPTGLTITNVGDNGYTVTWDSVTEAVSYNVSLNGNSITESETSYTATGLIPGTLYSVQVAANCDAGGSGPSANTTIRTTGTAPLNYCTSNGNSVADEYIGRVQLGTIDNISGGTSGGYKDNTSIFTNLTKGGSTTITITPNWTRRTYSEGYSVWIDYNKDGDFEDSGEQVFTKAPSKTTPVSGTFTIPTSAITGATRMRVSMKYNGVPTACEIFSFGEVEDYTVNLVSGVADTTPPVITLNGSSIIDLEQGDTYTELGATATDDVDLNLSSNIIITGTVDTRTIGAYTIIYTVSDAAGNAAPEVIRTVNVLPDTTAPVITLIGDATINLNLGGESYVDQGAEATDNFDGIISGDIQTGGDTVDINTAGSYDITYNVSDAAGNAAVEVTRTVIVASDTTAPVITLIGNATINLNIGDPYSDQGATATDNVDGDLTSSINITGAVDTSIAGTYYKYYNVSDTAGNPAEQVTRTIVIQDTTPPIITLIGDATINLILGDAYNEEGATATDNVDGDLTSSINITGAVDTSIAGTYYKYYNVSDTAGNPAEQVTRTILVGLDCSGESPWDPSATYSDTDIVVYEADGHLWEYKSRKSGNSTPGTKGKWVDLGACGSLPVNVTNNQTASIGTSNYGFNFDTQNEEDFEGLLLYPNPVKGDILNIKLSGNTEISYKIVNISGQRVMSGSTKREIKVGHLQAGLYFIEFNDGEIITKKFIKQ